LIHLLHGRRIEVAGFNFVGYQYTPPFAGERFRKQDGEIAADLVSFEPLVNQRTVPVTHTPAYGTLDLCDSGNVGSGAVAALLRKQPLANIHGHIHYRFGIDHNHCNVAAAAQCRTMMIDLPSLEYEVIRHERCRVPHSSRFCLSGDLNLPRTRHQHRCRQPQRNP